MKFFLATKNIDKCGHLDFSQIDILCENGFFYTAFNAEYLSDEEGEFMGCVTVNANGKLKVKPEFYYQGLRTKEQIATNIKQFLIDNTDGTFEFWGYESAFAWINLFQIFSGNQSYYPVDGESKLSAMPTYCNELAQALPSGFILPEGDRDAIWVKSVYDNMMKVKELDNKALYASIIEDCEQQYFNKY